MHAVKSKKMIKKLIKNGANVNAQDKQGITPLMAFLKRGDHDKAIVLEFIYAGVDITLQGTFFESLFVIDRLL